MVAALEDLFAYSKDQGLLKRLTAALYKIASQVWSEGQGENTESVYAKRKQHAYRILQQGESFVSQWALMLVTTGRLTPLTRDDELEGLVHEFWDQFAGITDFDRAIPQPGPPPPDPPPAT